MVTISVSRCSFLCFILCVILNFSADDYDVEEEEEDSLDMTNTGFYGTKYFEV